MEEAQVCVFRCVFRETLFRQGQSSKLCDMSSDGFGEDAECVQRCEGLEEKQDETE